MLTTKCSVPETSDFKDRPVQAKALKGQSINLVALIEGIFTGTLFESRWQQYSFVQGFNTKSKEIHGPHGSQRRGPPAFDYTLFSR